MRHGEGARRRARQSRRQTQQDCPPRADLPQARLRRVAPRNDPRGVLQRTLQFPYPQFLRPDFRHELFNLAIILA